MKDLDSPPSKEIGWLLLEIATGLMLHGWGQTAFVAAASVGKGLSEVKVLKRSDREEE